MQKPSLFILAFTSLSLTLHASWKHSGVDWDEITEVKRTKFAQKSIKCGVFSYSSNDNDFRTNFIAQDFNEWKEACAKSANKFIYNIAKPSQKDIDDYEKCRNLTSELTLALVVINQKKYEYSQDFKAIRKTLEPVIQAAKRMNGSFLKKFKDSLSKETQGRDVINLIKDILNRRVNELINDFNEKIKTSDKKDIKKLSL